MFVISWAMAPQLFSYQIFAAKVSSLQISPKVDDNRIRDKAMSLQVLLNVTESLGQARDHMESLTHNEAINDTIG